MHIIYTMEDKNYKRIETAFSFIKWSVYFGCFFSLVIVLWDVWNKHNEKMTGTAVEIVDYQSLLLPAMTICPARGYKTKAN